MWRPVTFITSVVILCILEFASLQGLAGTAAPNTYAWIGEFASADSNAKTITVKVRIPKRAATYINRFKPGDRIMLIWDMIQRPDTETTRKPEPGTSAARGNAPDATKPIATDGASKASPPPPVALKTESDIVLYIDSSEAMSKIDTGYILPAEFVSADAETVTVKVRVPDSTLKALTSIQAGRLVRFTTSMIQPTGITAISAVTTVN